MNDDGRPLNRSEYEAWRQFAASSDYRELDDAMWDVVIDWARSHPPTSPLRQPDDSVFKLPSKKQQQECDHSEHEGQGGLEIWHTVLPDEAEIHDGVMVRMIASKRTHVRFEVTLERGVMNAVFEAIDHYQDHECEVGGFVLDCYIESLMTKLLERLGE